LKRVFITSRNFIFLALAILPAWSADANRASKAPDLSHFVVIGDSLGAGFQNFSLYDSESDKFAPRGGQRFGFAAFIARQAKTDLDLPLIAYPGIPPVLSLEGKDIVTRGTKTGRREPPLTVQTRDLSVPGYTVIDAILHSVNVAKVEKDLKNASVEDVLTIEVLGFPSLEKGATPCGVYPLPNGDVLFSEAACAIELKPKTILISLGSNDVLQSLIDGIPPTSLKKFSEAYTFLLEGLNLESGAQLVVSNVPNVTEVPFLFSVDEFEAICHAPPSGAGPNDYVVPSIANPKTTTFNICTDYAVRSASLIADVRTAVHDYNIVITAAAKKSGAALVDVNKLFAEITRNGYTVGKHHLTTQYLGGIFSLDAVHPTNTGYAILANAYIESMNHELGAKIPLVNVEEVADTDPLVPK